MASAQPGLKINFDGGFLDGGRTLGIGVIARNAAGECLAWQSLRLDRGGSAIMAEALAAREAIRLALRYRWFRVVLEGDNRSLMKMFPLLKLIFQLLVPLLQMFFISHLSSTLFHSRLSCVWATQLLTF
ncbi:UNVERIFIED_CONTAM: hypothetical protein Slati_1173400 [Sesamum latifolium]|uniref:RNase H type-1 domain-containing protein n=1 Tax=Sesamum latifolium TaxID=2727402 RepID=A0AAW2XE39_9LAMI